MWCSDPQTAQNGRDPGDERKEYITTYFYFNTKQKV